MREIHTPLNVPELDLKGQPDSPATLSDNIQQVLSTLCGFWKNRRTLLKSSPSGILFTASPQLEEIYHVTGVGANDTYQGENKPCTEVMVMGHPDNTGKIWVRTKKAASVDNAWPLDANDATGFTITNLNMLHILTVLDGEKAIIAYSI